jgi:cysteine desulfurase/selenocysteine lyase
MDINKIRSDFPELEKKVNGNPLVYFDNAATSLKPLQVIESISGYYSGYNSNVHRAGHRMSALATQAYENARSKIAKFINAKHSNEIIFTSGTTESINLLASIFENSILTDGDEIILTQMEHHSNIVPWVALKEKLKLNIKIIDIDENGNLLIDNPDEIWSVKTRVLSIVHSSNVLGIINPVRKLIHSAKKRGIITVVDGAQAIVHTGVDVQELDCDFYCFSGHKLYAPMGIGVLYGKKSLLDEMPVYQKGGGMIDKVSFENISYNVLPYKYEAGTPNVGGAIGLASAIDYISEIGFEDIFKYESELLAYATDSLNDIDGINIFGKTKDKDPILSFEIEGIHNYDLGAILDQFGIALRTGHHCAQPLMKKLGIKGTTRISFSFYNIKKEIDYFVDKIKIAINMLR